MDINSKIINMKNRNSYRQVQKLCSLTHGYHLFHQRTVNRVTSAKDCDNRFNPALSASHLGLFERLGIAGCQHEYQALVVMMYLSSVVSWKRHCTISKHLNNASRGSWLSNSKMFWTIFVTKTIHHLWKKWLKTK